jgi:RimJ/RimL family protein N-acetyltransferase
MTPVLELVPIPTDVLRRLARWDLSAASSAMGLTMPPSTLDMQWVWNAFAVRAEADPENAFWYTQYFAVEDGRVVADVRMHAPPDGTGMVSIGYQVEPIERRRGVAVVATRLLLDVAAARPEVRRVVALVAPTNRASLAVCGRLGFTDVGEQLHQHSGTMMRRLELATVGAR